MASDTDIGEISVALKQLTEIIEDLLSYGRDAIKGIYIYLNFRTEMSKETSIDQCFMQLTRDDR